ncbi:hypothetical protein EDD86DRAFT_268557 [Gorgonomyces haynaldii]|nr:hypothetical protein EDD86DRAFT_268557 [Gorgonomyces haynaldii]
MDASTHVVVEHWDGFFIALSYWSAVLGAYTAIQLFTRFLKWMFSLDVSDKSSVHSGGPNESMAFKTFYILLISVALAVCGIWAMHFIGMNALTIYVVPRDVYNAGSVDYEKYIVPQYYNIWVTLFSMILAIFAVFLGFMLVFHGLGLLNGKDRQELLRNMHTDNSGHARSSKSDSPYQLKRILVDYIGSNHARSSTAHEVPPSPGNTASELSASALSPPVQSPTLLSPSVQSPTLLSPTLNQSATSPAPLIPEPKKEPKEITPLLKPAPPGVQKSTDVLAEKQDKNLLKKLLQMTNKKVEDRLRKYTFGSLSIGQKIFFISGGCFAGLGVSGMHYTGMMAMRIPNVTFTHNPIMIGVATLIAMVVATVGMWILFFLRGERMRLLAAFVIALAVCSMHYTGMLGMKFYVSPGTAANGSEFRGDIAELWIGHAAFSLELLLLHWSRRRFTAQ